MIDHAKETRNLWQMRIAFTGIILGIALASPNIIALSAGWFIASAQAVHV